jgi:hypothetical protein
MPSDEAHFKGARIIPNQSEPRYFGAICLKWSPVLELHQRARFCRPLPELLG